MKYLLRLFILSVLFVTAFKASAQQTIPAVFELAPQSGACDSSLQKQWVLLKKNPKGQYQNINTRKQKSCRAEYQLAEGAYKLSVLAEGFYSLDTTFIIAAGSSSFSLSSLAPQNKVQAMEAAVVKSPMQKSISFQNDKMIVDVKNNALMNTASTYEALEKVPGVMIDANNKVTLNGKGGVSIWMDGQPTNLAAEDLNNLLRSLPADAVEKIEVISNPGAAYDAQGSGGVINIVTFKSKIRGMNGSLSGNVSRGAYWRYNSTLRMNTKYKGFNTQLIAGYNVFKNENQTQLARTIQSSGQRFDQQTTRINDRKSPFMRFTADYDFTRKFNAGVRFNMNGADANNPFVNKNFANGAINPLLQSSGDNTGEVRQKDMGAFLTYKFNNEGMKLNLIADVTEYKNDNFSPVTEIISGSGTRYNTSRQQLRQKIYSIKSDFNYPIVKAKAAVDAGVKYTNTDMLNNGRYALNSSVKNFENTVFNQFTNYNFNEQIFAAYTSASKTMGRLNMGAGLRLENTRTISRIPGGARYYDTAYTNLFPNINLNYKITEQLKFTASFARRINRPGYGDLDPNFDYTDSLSIERGNPNIFPTFSNSIETRLSVFDFAQISFSYSYENNPSYLVLQTNGNQSIQTNQNLKYARNYSFNTFMPIPLDFFFKPKQFKANMSSGNMSKMNVLGFFTNMMYNKVDGMERFVTNNKPLWVWGGFLQLYLPKETTLQSNFWRQGNGVTQLYSIRPQYSWDMTLSKFFLNKKLRVNLAVNDILKSRVIDVTAGFPGVNGLYRNTFDSRVFRLSFTYNFGKFSQLNKREVNNANEEEKQRVGQKKGF
jgi:iron complex outermembrane recepter protein